MAIVITLVSLQPRGGATSFPQFSLLPVGERTWERGRGRGTQQLVPPWPGLQLKFSFFFGSVIFKSSKVGSFENVIIKNIKTASSLPHQELNFATLRSPLTCSIFLPFWLWGITFTEKKENWASLLISRHVILSTNVKDYSLTVY